MEIAIAYANKLSERKVNVSSRTFTSPNTALHNKYGLCFNDITFVLRLLTIE